MTLNPSRRMRWLMQILAFLLLLAACSSSTVLDEAQAPADADVEEASSAEEETAEVAGAVETEEDEDDELAGASEEETADALTDQIEAIMIDWQESGGMPAVSLSVRLPGRDPINLANGVTDLTTNTPVEVDDFFRIGSITKPMTSAIVLQLVDEGLIELDAPVQTYVPLWLDGYQYASEITIRQLLNHTNGLIEYAVDPGFFVQAGPRLEQPLAAEEIYDFLAVQEPLFAPGEQYSYETGGFFTLGTVIEAVTGNTAAAEMRERIFEPAGAENIYLAPQETPPSEAVNGYGRGQLYVAGTALLGREDTLGLIINDEPVVDFGELPQEVARSAGWTGGGNEAQLESVSAIMGALFDGTILTEAQIEEMSQPTLDETYGLGVSVDEVAGTQVISHGGGVPGFRSHGAYLPEHDVSWAVSASLIPLPESANLTVLINELTPLLIEAAS